jgi:A/G-specific adenine glycosylase
VKRQLLRWFHAHGRALPWRETSDPYAILVSEVMLQQTQVERVLPRYRRFLERWPTVEALAAAPAADVIVEWQGLGYNRRALMLHRAARVVADRGWPSDLTELPGVGPYTAAAIANFAFGRDVLPLDTNVRRVQARTGETFDASCAQALFDLGATICLARVPRCGDCPLAGLCPSRGRRYEPLRRQSRFEGSFRQRRANALWAVAGGRDPGDAEAVAALVRDGLLTPDGALPREGRPEQAAREDGRADAVSGARAAPPRARRAPRRGR